ncbi:MAG: guanylate kinase [Bacteroidales bacterium]|jgi:guanylate kinase
MQKMLIFSAPSGAGKTTIVKHLLGKIPNLMFSISATSREPRINEINGVDYYFLSVNEFKNKIKNNCFVEWEEVYTDTFYGTLKTEVDRIWNLNKCVIFDVDVKGGINIKNKYGNKALSVFIKPPSLKVLEERLRNRGTNTEEDIKRRIQKAEYEISFSDQFDKILINDNLQTAFDKSIEIVENFLNN